ncbi:hypothetical protein NOR_05194 [Metarhizium rileyi]|uniref:Retroviral polymerase SH3-like domain-containing protein n=1 Tax=Metarhizium rileyi (strain RCEF 4871) TaxID=1649241 RepID=A0A167CX97_METRR|nr:hypothetical protein NOR_05194 [Metarhizium rileyi RCEF 4871]
MEAVKCELSSLHKRAFKTSAHAEIGYLVGFDSTNIFRVWIPSKSEARRVRDVTFDEKAFYQGHSPQIPVQQSEITEFPAQIESDDENDEIRSTIEVNTQDLQSNEEGSELSGPNIFEDPKSPAFNALKDPEGHNGYLRKL